MHSSASSYHEFKDPEAMCDLQEFLALSGQDTKSMLGRMRDGSKPVLSTPCSTWYLVDINSLDLMLAVPRMVI